MSIASALTRVRMEGYAFLDSFCPEIPTNDLLGMFGNAVALGTGDAVHEIRPHSAEEAPANTYSGNYGLGEFPLHTDLAHWYIPPSYLLLRCLVGFGEVPTILVDSAPLVKAIGAMALIRTLLQPRRPIAGRLPLLRLYQQVENERHLVRWDTKFVKPVTQAGRHGVTMFNDVLAAATRIYVTLKKPGDILILDNWRMLHGRACVPENCRDRVIERAYLGTLYQ